MSAIDQIVQILITSAAQQVTQANFSIPLIMGPSTPGWSDRLRTYASPAAMLTDGYTVSNPEYIYASAMYAQPLIPTTFKVGRRTAGAGQTDVITINNLNLNGTYSIGVSGTNYGYLTASQDTQQSILTALKGQLNGVTGITSTTVAGTGSSATLTIVWAGAALYSGTPDPKLTVTTTVPGGGLAGDLALAAAADNTWYGVCCAGATDTDIFNAATWVEANNKLMVQASSTAAIGVASTTTDVASLLKAAAFKRTALVFSPGAAAAGVDAAWLSSQLAQTPGSNNWAFKNLAGITADTLTDAQRAACIGTPVAQVLGKNANIYSPLGGVNITQMGSTASGQWIDITVGLDWLKSAIQTNIYSTIVNVAKVPYTDVGTAAIIAQVTAALQQGGRNGLIDTASPITVTAPKVSTVSQNQRAGRVSPPITFGCRLQGAFNAIQVQGTVAV